jgi:hypothetical protein
MKKIFILIAIVLTITTLQGQTQLLKDGLIKEKIKIGNNSKYITKYSDGKFSLANLPRPSDKDNNIAEIANAKLNSIEKLDQITQKIFTSEQAKCLAENRCYFSCVLSSLGKIVSVSITFSNNDPAIDRKQLVEFSNQIKENLSFDLSFDREVKQIGYILLTHPAFPSLMKPKHKKAKT